MDIITGNTIYILILMLVFMVGIWLTWRVQQIWQRRQGFINQKKGRRAEHEAARLLEDEGFQIVDHNPSFTNELVVNGDTHLFSITPDFIVCKDGIYYCVEVKNYTGHSSIQNAAIRRQVFEYLHATKMPCLLIRMPEGDIDMIESP